MDSDLKKLIEQCKANNQKAFETLYKKYYRVLLGIALRYSRTTFEAEDILQDSFIKVFHSIRLYQNEGSFEGWLKRIVQNTAINHYRQNIKFNLHLEISSDDNTLSDDGFNSVFESFNTKDIVLLLNKLPEGYRIIINLYCIDGYQHKEISEMLNISIGTSKSQLFKAKNYLKNLIELEYKQHTA